MGEGIVITFKKPEFSNWRAKIQRGDAWASKKVVQELLLSCQWSKEGCGDVREKNIQLSWRIKKTDSVEWITTNQKRRTIVPVERSWEESGRDLHLRRASEHQAHHGWHQWGLQGFWSWYIWFCLRGGEQSRTVILYLGASPLQTYGIIHTWGLIAYQVRYHGRRFDPGG